MRRIISLLSICLCFASQSEAQQWVSIPDTNMRNSLITYNNLAGCFNATGDSIDATCPAVLSKAYLEVYQSSTFEGLQVFTNLQTLLCANTIATDYNYVPSGLQTLVIDACAFTSLPVIPLNITYLEIMECEQLITIPSLPSSLQTLSLLFDTALVNLPMVWPNNLTNLTVAGMSNLQFNYPTNLQKLEVTASDQASYPPFPNSLKFIFIDNSIIYSLPSMANTSVDTIIITNGTFLSGLPALPSSIKYINVYHTPITSLPTLPNGIEEIYCENHKLSSLPALPVSLKVLSVPAGISNNYNPTINTLPALPVGLEELDFSGLPISVIPAIPSTLKKLNCSATSISMLPTLPSSLEYLDCSYTSITSLPTLNNGLKQLIAKHYYPNPPGNLTSIANLPSTLEYIDVTNNQLTSLPTLPSSLQYLAAAVNQLTSISALPSGLQYLNVGYNQLTSIPSFPSSLTKIYLDSNQITVLPTPPPYLASLGISSNPISCIPSLPANMFQLYLNNTNVQCLPNSVTAQYSSPPLSSFPICDTGNINGCPVNWNVAGKFYLDSNANCSLDLSEDYISNIGYDIYRNATLIATFTNSPMGGFAVGGFANDTIIAQVDTAGLPIILSCGQADTNLIILTPIDTFSIDNHFSFGCPSGFDIVAQSVMTYDIFRPAMSTDVNLFTGSFAQFYGVDACSAPVGTVTATVTGASHVISANPTPNYISASGDTVVWNAVDFFTHDLLAPFMLTLLTDTTAAFNSQVCIDLSVTPAVGDNNPTNNTISNCFTVVNSYDPNDKQVSPPGDLPAYYGDWLTYTIRFQNTGTAEAINIRVEDTLSSYLDVNTFQLLSYSFQPQVQIDGQVVNFKFDNINLPDSNTNEPASHGYVQFRVKPTTWLMPAQPVNNTGYIYFDFNPAIVTNTVSSEVGNPTAVTTVNNSLLDAVVYPNPTKDKWTVQLPSNETDFTVTVTDMAGRMVSTQSSGGRNVASIGRNGAAAGVYLMKITTASGKAIVKRVVGE